MADRIKLKPTESSHFEIETVQTGGSPVKSPLRGFDSSNDLLSRTKVFCNHIVLNEGVTSLNFYCVWTYVLYMGIIGITYSTLEPQYLNKVLGVDDKNMGKTTAWLYLIDYSVRLVFALIYGPMIDYYGRKVVLYIGVILTSLGYFMIPVLDDSLFPGYVSAKCIASGGFIALQMLPFAADYVDDSTKGVMAGMNFGIAFVGGGIGAGIMKLLFWLDFSFRGIYWVLAAIILGMGLVLSLGIKGGNQYYKTNKAATNVEIADRSQRWEEVKKAFREIPWVSLSVIFGVLGNADFYILTTGLVIWIKSLVPEGQEQDPISIAANYQVIFFILSFILTATVALKIDKVSHMKLIYPILIVATLGFITVPFINTPNSPLLYLFFSIEGVSLPGVFVFSAYLSYRYNPPEIRGTLSGIGNGIGFLGAIIILSVGGFLHDHWRKDASFLLYGGLLVFSLISVIIIKQKMTKYHAKSEDPDMKRLAVGTPTNSDDVREATL